MPLGLNATDSHTPTCSEDFMTVNDFIEKLQELPTPLKRLEIVINDDMETYYVEDIEIGTGDFCESVVELKLNRVIWHGED